MKSQLVQWLLVGHIFSIVIWIGAIFSLLAILKVHGQHGAEGQKAFGRLEKNTAASMDMGGMLAIVFGMCLLFLPAGGTAIMKGAGFFHVKLLLVLFVLFVHVLIRRSIRKYREGELFKMPGWPFPMTILAVLGIITLIMVRPF